ncbi:TetR/AcrR family transcriptional regulator [Umezawaea sp. NPDC059074]|uniref:TetR/AcrR family transcriptional regulator n=1 Tax=Umezawaea sp. NPDC059074 TaxID=3346716 RepID=UPI0036C39D43
MTANQAIDPDRLTPKGLATRAHILERAAELIYRNGVQGTNNEQLRRAAEVSGSQLGRYFPDKESLVSAVIDWRANQILDLHTDGRFGDLDSIAALRDWAAFYIAYEGAYREGCSLGSLAGEIVKTDLDVHARLAAGFTRWKDLFRAGLARMRDSGRLRADADPRQLAELLMAAFQGGMLLSQIERDATPLRDALTAAVDHIETFATEGSPPT